MAHVAVVTGATGFIATQLVKQLLEKGYTVRGTVRSTKDSAKTEVLHALAQALPGNLELHEADLLSEGSFDAIVKGAHVVFHVASPFFRESADPQRELVDPALKGTRNVVSAAAKSKDTVRRIVLTSSCAAVANNKAGPVNGKLFSDQDWNTESSVSHEPYRYSKTLAEKAAWELSKEHGLDLITIQPSFVIGPVLGRRQDATSIKTLKALVEGQDPPVMNWLCDVRDVARAHVLAAEIPSAKGRYLVTQGDTHDVGELYEALSQRFPAYKYPSHPYKSEPKFDNSKVQNELGLQLTPVASSIIDAAASLYSIGVAKPEQK